MAKPAVLRMWVVMKEAETGIWCDVCQTSGGIRIPAITTNGVTEIRSCLTCRHKRAECSSD